MVLLELEDIDFIIESPQAPSVGHCRSYPLLLESYGDYMCDEPITSLIVNIKCFGYCNKPNCGHGS
jgi:hypothetical protein